MYKRQVVGSEAFCLLARNDPPLEQLASLKQLHIELAVLSMRPMDDALGMPSSRRPLPGTARSFQLDFARGSVLSVYLFR